ASVAPTRPRSVSKPVKASSISCHSMSPTSLSQTATSSATSFSLQRVGMSGDAATVPDYLEQLRLPGDDDVLAEVASLRESLMGAENEAARIRRNHVNQVD